MTSQLVISLSQSNLQHIYTYVQVFLQSLTLIGMHYVIIRVKISFTLLRSPKQKLTIVLITFIFLMNNFSPSIKGQDACENS